MPSFVTFPRIAQACFALGQLYVLGDGVARDSHLAKRYYDQSTEAQTALNPCVQCSSRVISHSGLGFDPVRCVSHVNLPPPTFARMGRAL